MASLTVRQLEESLKRRLRLRAARNGRSVEDEVRTILREAATEEAAKSPPCPRPKKSRRPQTTTKRVLLIIAGGIAAYKSLDLIRRLKERGFSVRCILTKAASSSSRRLRPARIAGETRFHRSVRSRARIRCRAYSARTRERS